MQDVLMVLFCLGFWVGFLFCLLLFLCLLLIFIVFFCCCFFVVVFWGVGLGLFACCRGFIIIIILGGLGFLYMFVCLGFFFLMGYNLV